MCGWLYSVAYLTTEMWQA